MTIRCIGQNFEDMRREYYEKDSLLNSKDTAKYTRAQLEIIEDLSDNAIKLQGMAAAGAAAIPAEAAGPDLSHSKEAVETVRLSQGEWIYLCVHQGALLVSPPAEDILPAREEKLVLNKVLVLTIRSRQG